MGEIEINLEQQWNFNFAVNDLDILVREREHCYYCEIPISKVYSYIISCLKEGSLLDKNYNPICCHCKVLEKFGLIGIRKDLCGFHYDEIEDILIIEFIFPKLVGKKESAAVLIWNRLYVNIHDYSKVKWD